MMRKCTVPFDLPFVQFLGTNLGEVLDFLRLAGNYVTSRDELWIYPDTSQAMQVFRTNFIVQFHPVVFRVFSEAEFKNIFEVDSARLT